jgi:peptide/nickel transport system substrate-binding protein
MQRYIILKLPIVPHVGRRQLALLAAPALLPGPLRAQAAPRPFRVVAPFEITGLDPARSGCVFARMGIAETLVGADDQGQPVAALADAWTLSDDRLSWRFRLRAGARFHDGTPVNAAAAAGSLKRARAQRVGPLAAAPVDGITAERDDTVLIRTSRPFAPLLAFLAQHTAIILAPASFGADGAVRAIIGSGPFRVARLDPPLRVETARFDAWWGGTGTVAVEQAGYLVVGQGETRAALAESGEADLALAIPAASVERVRRNPRVDLRLVTVPRTRLVKLNAGHPFFDDVRERRAFSLAIDRAGMARAILRNPAVSAGQLFPPALAGWHQPALAPLAHDPAEARRLLAECGWRAGADGILRQGDMLYRPTLRTFPDWPELPVIATACRRSCARSASTCRWRWATAAKSSPATATARCMPG